MVPAYDLGKIKFATDDHGNCTCYLGQVDTLCKHEDKRIVSKPTRSGRLGELSKEELAVTKKAITGARKYIKPYNGKETCFGWEEPLLELIKQ